MKNGLLAANAACTPILPGHTSSTQEVRRVEFDAVFPSAVARVRENIHKGSLKLTEAPLFDDIQTRVRFPVVAITNITLSFLSAHGETTPFVRAHPLIHSFIH